MTRKLLKQFCAWRASVHAKTARDERRAGNIELAYMAGHRADRWRRWLYSLSGIIAVAMVSMAGNNLPAQAAGASLNCVTSGTSVTCVTNYGPENGRGLGRVIVNVRAWTPEAIERDRAWMARCEPRLVPGKYGVEKYVYKFSDCANGVSR